MQILNVSEIEMVDGGVPRAILLAWEIIGDLFTADQLATIGENAIANDTSMQYAPVIYLN
ncbi:MAG: hypothetical protein QM599_02790 [Pseudoxanthomonas sp.]